MWELAIWCMKNKPVGKYSTLNVNSTSFIRPNVRSVWELSYLNKEATRETSFAMVGCFEKPVRIVHVLKNSCTKFGKLNKDKHTAVTLALLVGGKASICGETFQPIGQFTVHVIKHLSFLYLAGPCWITYCFGRIDALLAIFPPACSLCPLCPL